MNAQFALCLWHEYSCRNILVCSVLIHLFISSARPALLTGAIITSRDLIKFAEAYFY